MCLARPARVPNEAVLDDSSRPDSIALAKELFGIEEGAVRLARWFEQGPGVLVFPEYAFGSVDYGELDALISAYQRPLIVLAGFGAVSGNALNALLDRCRPAWPAGEIDPAARYNAGWCWIHHGPGQSACYIFLKNYFDQTVELPLIPDLKRGQNILRVEAEDLVLFPLICADLLSNEANGPRYRIGQNSPKLGNGTADANKRMVAAAMLYCAKPFHDLWKGAINDIVAMHGRKAAVLCVNQFAAIPREAEAEDDWRCLSGAFVDRSIMDTSPAASLRPVRYVQTDSSSGLILRRADAGVACGRLRWGISAAQGRYIWHPEVWRKFNNGVLTTIRESAAFLESKRFLARKKNRILAMYHDTSLPIVEPGMAKLAGELDESHITPRIWPKLVFGVSSANESPDRMANFSAQLERGLGALAAIQNVTNADALSGESHKGQLRWNEIEILVWASRDDDWRGMESQLLDSATRYPNEPQLVVFAQGARGQGPAPHRVERKRLDDITDRSQAGEITGSRIRHVYWRPLGDVENTLTDPASNEAQKRASMLDQINAN